MSSPLLHPSLSLMKLLVNSNSAFLNPSKNPLINYLLRISIYNHFCAGTNEDEVKRTVRDMKQLGFTGVILGYGREIVVKQDDSNTKTDQSESRRVAYENAVEEWKQGNLRTLKMIGSGDYLSMKFTGAGPAAVEALSRGDPVPPDSIKEAMREICSEIASQGSRLWIDAEQQVFQSTIDKWTLDLMREFNRNGSVVVFNTIQAYLKSSAETVNEHLLLAQQEGWTLGIKLVRGAYIAHDIRDRIHDTKEETDKNYNCIVEKLLTRQFLFPVDNTPDSKFPDVRLFLASHNAESVQKGHLLHRHRILSGDPTIPLQYGQLHGMADEVSCELVAESKRMNASNAKEKEAAPKAFKALCWGTTEECLHFLLRRAVENKGAVERTKHMADALREEAWRRLLRG
ncbi:Proline dehydrogenase [Aspergillus sclerotialis]|uniref:Proline dehydrogenase n=1 Tax=Aspergillus sclerotialis TaxID=2070753 RepID=A0A3A2ZG54_9EURO|nr:Proline dehydrogenase [Aspergillus sclerotialis]